MSCFIRRGVRPGPQVDADAPLCARIVGLVAVRAVVWVIAALDPDLRLRLGSRLSLDLGCTVRVHLDPDLHRASAKGWGGEFRLGKGHLMPSLRTARGDNWPRLVALRSSISITGGTLRLVTSNDLVVGHTLT